MNSTINKKVKLISLGHIDYQKAWKKQEKIFNKIINVKIQNRKDNSQIPTENYILVCSHPHVYTLGKSGNEKHLLINKKKDLIKKKISLNRIKNKIFELGVRKIDYIKLLDINKLIKPYRKNKRYKIFIAYYLRTTRLIDNI